jgi:type IV fimbrial biogenesis protein FimT
MKKLQSWAGSVAGTAGFTILELMITVAVLGILVGVGVPSFTDMIRQNRLSASTNDLLTATAIARSEAVKRGGPVTLCPANPLGNNCSGNALWSNGWIVFNDEGAVRGAVDGAAEVILQRWQPAAAQNINIVNNQNLLALTYLGSGATTLPAATQFTITGIQCADPNGRRTVDVIRAGRASATRRNCAG